MSLGPWNVLEPCERGFEAFDRFAEQPGLKEDLPGEERRVHRIRAVERRTPGLRERLPPHPLGEIIASQRKWFGNRAAPRPVVSRRDLTEDGVQLATFELEFLDWPARCGIGPIQLRGEDLGEFKLKLDGEMETLGREVRVQFQCPLRSPESSIEITEVR